MALTEKGVQDSFNNVKNDVIRVITRMDQLEREIAQLKKASRTTTKVVQTNERRTYVASKNGKVAHMSHTIHANNIKPKNRVVFKSKAAAIKAGYNVKA